MKTAGADSEPAPSGLGRFDHITLLPNRRQFLDDLGSVAPEDTRVLVLVTLADARAFNVLLRALGHAASERFVQEGAARLAEALGEQTAVYHVSVLSFAFLAPEDGREPAEALANRIARAFATPIPCEGVPIDTRVGVGLRPLPGGNPVTAEDLRAALAAAQESRTGTVGWAWYDRRADDAHMRAFRLLGDIEAALAAETQLHLVYQPKVELRSGRCLSAEALVRWTHPDLGTVSPGEFIPLVEATALVTPLTRWVVSEAVTTLSGWHRAGRDLALALNVSPKNLEEPDFVEYLVFCCAVRGLPHGALELEVTEGVNAADGPVMLARLKALRDLGFSIAIDDFGAGYSNMHYLTQLSAGTLKLDRSLITGLHETRTRRSLVAGLVKMAHDLDYKLVAEGVETAEDAALLARLGCDIGQGWHFARPLAAGDFLTWLDEHRFRAVV